MARTPDLNATISAAQSEVDSWEHRAKLAGHSRPVGSKWPLTVVMWVVLVLAIYAERHDIAAWTTPHDSGETIEQLSDILRHTADDIETYRAQFDELPDNLPIDFLNGVLSYTHEGESYTLETGYHDTLLQLQANAAGPGKIEVLPR